MKKIIQKKQDNENENGDGGSNKPPAFLVPIFWSKAKTFKMRGPSFWTCFAALSSHSFPTDFRPRVSQMAYIGAAGKPKKLAEGDVNKFIEKTQAPCVQRLIFLIQIAIWGHTQFSETPKHHLSTGEIW